MRVRAPSGAQERFLGDLRRPAHAARAGGWRSGSLAAPETCSTTAGPGSFPGSAAPLPGRRGCCCGRSPGITPRPRPGFRHPGVPHHPRSRHPAQGVPGTRHTTDTPRSPLRPTHPPAARARPSRRIPPHVAPANARATPAGSIMRLTAPRVRFVAANLMIDWKVGRPTAGPPAPSGCRRSRWRARPREILVRNGPHRGEDVPRSPSGRAGTDASRPRRTHPPSEILEENGPHGGPNLPRSPAGALPTSGRSIMRLTATKRTPRAVNFMIDATRGGEGAEGR